MIGDSLRSRLTIWYTCMLALVLVSFAAVSYFSIERAAERSENESVRNAAEALGSAIDEETAHDNGEDERPEPGGIDADVSDVVTAFRFGECRFYVENPSGALLATSRVAPEEATPERAAYYLAAALATPGSPGTIAGPDGGTLVYALRERTDSGTYTVIVACPRAEVRHRLADVRRAYAIAIPVALVLAAFGGNLLARKGLGQVIAMAAQAERIEASNLHERLRVPNERDEVGRLARVFNALLARLETSFERQRRFMADASHELRTPVAIVRGEAEVALSREDRTADDYRESLDIIHDEGRRLATIVDDLFMLARADAGQRPLLQEEVDLGELVADAARAVRSLADRRGVAVSLDPPAELPFSGDRALLARLVMNLLDNAIKYTPSGGHVDVRAGRRGDEYVVEVSDDGPGIPEAAQPLVFERFFRAEKARPNANDTGGAGLGLSIASWIAVAHGGRVELVSSSSAGTTFAIVLPAS